MAKIRGLKRCRLFAEMSFRELALLAPFVQEGEVPAAGPLAKAGEASQGLIILKRGQVRLVLEGADDSSVVLGEGEFFGELSLLNGSHPREVGAQALDACQYLRMTPQSFQELRNRYPEIAGKIALQALEITAKHVQQAQVAIKNLLSSNRPR